MKRVLEQLSFGICGLARLLDLDEHDRLCRRVAEREIDTPS